MLAVLRRGQRWILWLVIVGVGAVFVLYLGIGSGFDGGAGDPETVVAVGERRYDARDVLRVRARQEEEYRRVLGDGFDAEAASDFLDENAASLLMRVALLAGEAERLGLRASDDEVRAYLRSIPGVLGEDGKVDRDAITQWAEREYGSLKRFQQALRDDLLARKLGRLLTGGVAVSEAEARDALRAQATEVSLAVVRLDAGTAPEGLEVDEAEVERLLTGEADAVRQEYERRRAEFDRPEEVRASHVLVRVAEDAPEPEVEQARQRIEELRARIEGGADFADVALEASEDPGSKEQGGDLGFFPRGRMVKAFDEAAFSLEPKALSPVVRTPFGFHVIRVEERRPAVVIPFEEARQEVARDLARRRAGGEAARERAEALAAAVRGGQSLVDAAREQGVSIQRTDPLRRRPDGYLPGIGPAPDVTAAAFALRAERPSDPRVYPVGEAFVLIQLLERKEPGAEALSEETVAQAREQLAAERRAALETAWVEEARDQAVESGRLVYDLKPLRD
jgi:peptidyl-prolyl cis-trans isomerase D